MKTILILLIFAFMNISPILPCSTFALNSDAGLIMGKSYDFIFGHGLLTVNKRNVRKIALPPQDIKLLKYSAEWKSKYGSVTFNQFSVELPSGGINEKGLTIEQMWLVDGKYPEIENKPFVNELQWIQYQLDNYASVSEVIQNLNKVQIIATASTIHYMVCDSTGECTLISPVKGKLVSYSKNNFKTTASTNTEYMLNQVKFAEQEGKKFQDLPGDYNTGEEESQNRFCRIAYLLNDYKPGPEKEALSHARKILKEVEVKITLLMRIKHFFGGFLPASYWKTIYNTKSQTITFSTYSYEKERTINLNKLDFSCKSPRKILDLDEKVSGDILSNLKDYSREENQNLINKSIGFLSGKVTASQNEFLASYPEKLLCEE